MYYHHSIYFYLIMPYCYICKKNFNQREFDKDQNAHEKQEIEQKFLQFTTASSKTVHPSESVDEDAVMVDVAQEVGEAIVQNQQVEDEEDDEEDESDEEDVKPVTK